MKRNKIICIDEDIFEKLSHESNQSGLINDLLLNHYNTESKKIENDPKIIAKYEELLKEKEKNRKLLKNKKLEANILVEQWRNGEISEKQYWKAIDKLDGK